MRLQENMTGATLRLTPEDMGGFARELNCLFDDNSLIVGGRLDQLRAMFAPYLPDAPNRPGVPASVYMAEGRGHD